MRLLRFKIIPVLGFLFVALPSIAIAGDLTAPLTPPLTINSYFDHSSPGYIGSYPIIDGNITIYNGLVGLLSNGICGTSPTLFKYWSGPNGTGQCLSYDGHNGIDYQAVSNTPVLAAAPATVQESYFSLCNGEYIRLFHASQGYSTLYAHLSQRFVATGTPITRGQQVGTSGSTGTCSTGPHLHFGVRTGQTGGQVMDPYGWTPTATSSVQVDPWPYNQGYLWTTNPPSLTPPGTLPSVTVTGTISSNTTWVAGTVYKIQGTVTIPAGVTLTINPGVIVKFNPSFSGKIYVYGMLNAQGGMSAANKINFTSLYDDTIGGDTNGDGSASSPAAGNYYGMYFYPGSAGIFDNAIIRYGAYEVFPGTSGGVIKNLGGNVTVNNSQISQSWFRGFYQSSGVTIIQDSLFDSNANYGIFAEGGAVTVTGTTFTNHFTADGYILGAVNFFQAFNSASGPGPHGFKIWGTLLFDQIWNSGIPYMIPSTFAVPSGKTLTINPGTIVKFDYGTGILVSGALIAQGDAPVFSSAGSASGATFSSSTPSTSPVPSPPSSIYFTSTYDDTVGGDTNGDGAATIPAMSDYHGLTFDPGSTGNFSNVAFRYGGNSATSVWGVLKNNGGTISITSSQFSNNYYGYNQTSGSSTIASSQFSANGLYGAYFNAGNTTVMNSIFSNHSVSDIFLLATVPFVNLGNTSNGPGKHGIRIWGTLSSSQSWNSGIPFVIFSSVTVGAGSTLTINPGTIVKFLVPSTKIYVYGSVLAQGGSASSSKVYFTSFNDDTVGGDTGGDGNATVPSQTDHEGFYFYSGSTGNFTNAVLRYGTKQTGYPFAVIRNAGGNVSIVSTRLQNNYAGVEHQGGITTISQSSIHNNSSLGAYAAAGMTMNAQNNWWGSVNGPYNATSNPSGTGNSVSNGVAFIPWLTSDPN